MKHRKNSILERIVEPRRQNATPIEDLGLCQGPGCGVNNIIAVYNQATPAEKDYWGRWYIHAQEDVQEIAIAHGIDFRVAAAIVAVLSPGNLWNGNLRAARRVLEGFNSVNAFGQQVKVAQEIARTGDYRLVKGPKVTVFYNSLLNPKEVKDHMVLDGHAINIWRGHKINIKGLK